MRANSEKTLARTGVYAFLVISAAFFLMPFYVMVVTSLKTMDEIRVTSIFALPDAPTLEAWVTAWQSACTGLNCNGLSVGFFILASERHRADLWHPACCGLHSLSGLHLPAGADAEPGGAL